MVGLEWLNREESVVATREVEGPQGPQPKRARNREASTPWHCLITLTGLSKFQWPVFRAGSRVSLGEEAQPGN